MRFGRLASAAVVFSAFLSVAVGQTLPPAMPSSAEDPAPVKAEDIVAICEAWAAQAAAGEREAASRGWQTRSIARYRPISQFTRHIMVERSGDWAARFVLEDVDYPDRRLANCEYSGFGPDSLARMNALKEVMRRSGYAGPSLGASNDQTPPRSYQLWSRNESTLELLASAQETPTLVVGHGNFINLEFQLTAIVKAVKR